MTPEDGGYSTRTREFASLRAAGEWVASLGEGHEFLDIRAIDVGPLNDAERSAFAIFTDGKVVLS